MRRMLLETLTRPGMMSVAMAGARLLGRLTGDKSGGVPPFLAKLLSGQNAQTPMPLPDTLSLRPAHLPYRTRARGEQRGRRTQGHFEMQDAVVP